jgi:hypothetical protein
MSDKTNSKLSSSLMKDTLSICVEEPGLKVLKDLPEVLET